MDLLASSIVCEGAQDGSTAKQRTDPEEEEERCERWPGYGCCDAALSPAIIRSCPCQGLGHLALMTVDESGGRTGIAEAMLSSQAYPWDQGAAIIQSWRQAGSSHSFGEILASMPPTTGKQRQHQFRRQSLEVPEVDSSASDEEPSQSESKGNAGPWDQDSSDSDQPVHKGPWEDSDPVDPVDYGPWGSSHSPNPTEVAKEDDNPWSSEPQPKRSKQQQRPLTSQLPAARDSPWA